MLDIAKIPLLWIIGVQSFWPVGWMDNAWSFHRLNPVECHSAMQRGVGEGCSPDLIQLCHGRGLGLAQTRPHVVGKEGTMTWPWSSSVGGGAWLGPELAPWWRAWPSPMGGKEHGPASTWQAEGGVYGPAPQVGMGERRCGLAPNQPCRERGCVWPGIAGRKGCSSAPTQQSGGKGHGLTPVWPGRWSWPSLYLPCRTWDLAVGRGGSTATAFLLPNFPINGEPNGLDSKAPQAILGSWAGGLAPLL